MGINVDALDFLLAARARGAHFREVLTIGRQALFELDAAAISRAFERVGQELSPEAAQHVMTGHGGYADGLLQHLGAVEPNSLDASPFEGCTVLQDMNSAIPEHLENRFSAVFDGGTLEHVFNAPVAIANCMRMVRVGGHLLVATPTNNYAGHGFYQFSPELYYRVLSPANGFRVKRMLLKEAGIRRRWYEVADPAALGRRVTLVNAAPTLLFILAEKTAPVMPFSDPPQQSDYATAWSAPIAQAGIGPSTGLGGRTRAFVRRSAPAAATKIIGRELARHVLLHDRKAFRPLSLQDL
jgi:SAM-dependent methyltransferase